MRVLFVHEISYALKPVFEYQEFIDGLAENGDSVAVFNFNETNKSIELEPFSVFVPRRLNPEYNLQTFTPLVAGRGIIARLLACVTGLISLPIAFRRFRPDIVINYSVPTFGLPVILCSRLFRVPVIFRSIDVSHKIRQTFFAPLVRVWERFVCKASSHISTHNATLKEYCLSMGGMSHSTSIEYPPVQDLIFEGSIKSREESRKYLGIGMKDAGVTYLVLGTQFSFSGAVKLVSCFREVGGSDDTLLMVGDGELAQQVRDSARGDERIFCLPPVPYEMIPTVFSVSDVSLVALTVMS